MNRVKLNTAVLIALGCLLGQLTGRLFAQDNIVLPPPKPSGLPDVSDLGDVLLGPPPTSSQHAQTRGENLVSLTTLRAPKKARKAYAAGLNAVAQHKWSAAQNAFSRAVSLYPRYAPAWDELGRVFEQKGNNQLAQAAYRKGVDADPAYARSYSDLAKLAIFGREWPVALEMSAGAIRLRLGDQPAVWLYNAIAAIQLGQWDTASKSAQAALDRDDQHAYPVAEYVLGTALDHRGRMEEASVHYRAFLANSQNSENASQIRRRLTELETGLHPVNQ